MNMLVLAFALSACSNNNNEPKEEMNHENMDHENMEQNTDESSKGNASQDKMVATPPSEFNDNAASNLMVSNTKNVTRLDTDDPIAMAVMVSQTVWASTHKESQPGAVILAPVDNWAITLASADLIHHPNNGPILFMNKDGIPEISMNEIKRLNPTGNMNGVQIMVMGDVDDTVLASLKDYKVEQVKGSDAATFAKDIDETYAKLTGSYPISVIVGSLEDDARLYTTPAIHWIAHMPEPILYVKKEEIPEATKQALKERKNKANIYVLGPESIVSKETEKALSEYGKVTRISGETPVSNSIEFAKFRDEEAKFGWGLQDSGHGISIISLSTPDLALAGAPFAHLGKHAPMIWTDGELTQEHYDFFATIKPMFKDNPTVGPYNHAFLLGNLNNIPFKTQGIIDEQLEIVSEDGMGHGGH
ncbi:ArsR family transcriptional regulator [Paenibacillus sp. IHBB 10380]|nr:ArsR family transcriptional regulator [Paenibacillus sp. IHBB 10380]